MRPREFLFQNDYVMADSGTLITNLDVTDPISQILLTIRGTNGATYNKASPLSHCISKIELVDGSDVLWSLSGLLAKGFWSNLNRSAIHQKLTEIGGDTPYETIPINFGRYLYDPSYALNPVAFVNPQLKITWDLATVNAVGATGFVSGSGRLTIHARLMEQATAPVGFLSTKNIYEFTSAASGDEIVDMNVDRPYRVLAVRAYEAGTALASSLTNLKLSLGGDKYIPFDLSTAKFYRMMASLLGLYDFGQLLCASDSAASQTWIAFFDSLKLTARSTDNIVGADAPNASQVTPYIVNGAGTAQSNVGVWCDIIGQCCENMLVYPFGLLNDPDTWLDAATERMMKLYLSQGNAGATVDILTQQVRKY